MRSRRWLAWAAVAVLLGVSPLAFNALPDQTWLGGIYDDGDEDETSLARARMLAPAIATSLADVPSAAGPVAISFGPAEQVPPVHDPRPSQTRAPPALPRPPELT